MADFSKFGAGVLDMAHALSGNIDRSAAASFLMMQQAAIQEQNITDRVAEKNKAASQTPGAQSSDPAVTGRAAGAMARMKALAASKRG